MNFEMGFRSGHTTPREEIQYCRRMIDGVPGTVGYSKIIYHR